MKKFAKLLLALILVATLIFAVTGCKSEQLETPKNLKYDGATLVWDAVEGATGYTVRINDGSEYTVTTPSYSYDAAGAEFSATVTATSSEKKVDDSESATMSFKPLTNITEVRFDENGVASWDVVNTANAYSIRIDGQEITTVTTTTYSAIPVGTHSFQVRPVVSGDASYYSSWSKSYNVNLLGVVDKDNVKYNNGLLSWNYVSGAQYYEVTVNGVIIAEKNSGTSILYDAQNLDFEVNIKALGNGVSTFSGAQSETKKFIFLDTVTNIIVEDGILKWDTVGGADGYTIKLNGVEQNEKLTSNEYKKLVANASISVQIRPYSNDNTYFSDWSQQKDLFILPAPILQWNQDYELDGEANNNAYWDGISNAASYTVRLTGPDGSVATKDYGSTERSFTEAYLTVGTYTVEVKANATADSTTTYGSVWSKPITVIRLATPLAASNNYITSDANSVAKGFTVTFDKVAGATSYELIKDNVSFKTTTTNQFVVGDIVADSVTAEQNYNFAIRALGGVKSVNGQIVATLGSLTQEALTFKIKVLPTPTNPIMDGYKYMYGTVEGANGYVVDVGGTNYTSSNGEYDLGIIEAGSYVVKVCARGNGSDVLASNYTAPTTVQRLAPPTNIRISVADASEGVLTFDKVMYAQGYHIVFNNDGNPVPVGEVMNIKQYITETPGTDIHMIASANYYNEDNTVYYMTSQSSTTFRCIKLSAPTFGDVAFTDTQFFWKAPANTNTSIYTPTYIVYKANGTEYNGEKNGTTMDISYLEGGQSYTFQVKAVGNGTNYINSEKSESITIYKLATPVVSRENGKYVWSSVANATEYVVYVDGELKATYNHEPGKTYEYTPDFDQLKDYTVEIQAIGDEGYTTINSDKCRIVQKTKQLTTPDFSVSYSEDRYSETGKIIVTITDMPAYAKGYSYTIGGTTHTSTETTYSLITNTVGTIETRVYALGGNFDEDGVYYLDSRSAGGSSKTIVLLASPDSTSFRLSEDGVLSWATITGAVGYEIKITINGGETQTIDNLTQPSYTLTNYSEINTLTVEIAAKGDGNKIISSVFSEYTWYNVNG